MDDGVILLKWIRADLNVVEQALMNVFQAVRVCIVQKYATIRGRASRSEFFGYLIPFLLFCLFWSLMIWSLEVYEGDINLLDFVLMYIPFLFVPPLVAVTIRRLHDSDKSGWLIILLLIPLVNIFGFALLFMAPTPGPNKYGDPASGP